ncbi:4'-phosphopantetheinyl transferase family protein [Methylophaga sp. OBS3]|uniref:4'-phosphopantetheinyl transferase family protein n=1 Tax=Methylophaga sp. OBS3 TaxID=2991934 RepID=UPI002253C5BD|nr:4'-phosphopantetheinyl transferase superfamily protein [Methylophaga sp. OBS3]MCX4189062.1 4'-phosphopantetheinyl transferase superfamily protein [Methylophaga sp. OBS3]
MANFAKLWLLNTSEINPLPSSTSPSWLSNSELTRLSKIKTIKRKHTYLVSRLLIRQALSQHFDKPLHFWQLIEQGNLPPEIINLPSNILFSLSHSEDWIGLALADVAVGVDIEIKQQRDWLKTAALFMSAGEFNDFQQHPNPDSFYTSWTMKEAYFKAFPKQQDTLSLSGIPVQKLRESNSYTSIDLTNQSYQLALFVDSAIDALTCFTNQQSIAWWQENISPPNLDFNWRPSAFEWIE